MPAFQSIAMMMIYILQKYNSTVFPPSFLLNFVANSVVREILVCNRVHESETAAAAVSMAYDIGDPCREVVCTKKIWTALKKFSAEKMEADCLHKKIISASAAGMRENLIAQFATWLK